MIHQLIEPAVMTPPEPGASVAQIAAAATAAAKGWIEQTPRPQTAVAREWRREQRGRTYGIQWPILPIHSLLGERTYRSNH